MRKTADNGNFEIFAIAFILLITIVIIFERCNSQTITEKKVAEKYCSSCHLFPEPSLLDKTTWEKNILPAMAPHLGIRYFLDSPYEINDEIKRNAVNNAPQGQLINISAWKKIIDYYKENAPATNLPQNRQPIQKFTDQFKIAEPLPDEGNPSVSYIKIDEGNQWIYTGTAADSSLNIYNAKLQLLTKQNVHGIIVDMQFNTLLDKSGERSGIFTNIGIMNPNDLKAGTADSFYINKDGAQFYQQQVLSHLPRPVAITKADLDKDGMQDYLVNGFGNTTGALYWMKNEGNKQYQQNTMRPFPGAIKTYIDDYNNDGLPDIMALMTQAQEGIYLFTNKGNGSFDTKTILQFPAVYGSSYFELDDFNNDGYKDILYTCGDNADYSSRALKHYHGVYIFINDGKNNFTEKYFFPIHGCYKAIARDFDNDSDLDIAAISFFPDSKNQPQESFVYLENKGLSYFSKSFQFEPYSIKAFNEGHWLTMDAGDIDGDGDEDIALGSFNPPPKELERAPKDSTKPSFLLLVNKTKSKASQ
ncbi:VCBS repeat-containing protein [Panacibacter ginsenosidivorans]|uniref:VCBS repeat-containing protein n=1 Tax=Panacibacter ginsenosidivorans TaxID=1813871 RepID=A0A5B8V6U6_9BACT|nr:VCBS repeat-containing protein [Panacibacter ginsenosidivorans]QEC66613.1 VCBS repeat-containing protein [Panacibacter ginsenosidivorans]